jgi:nucleoside-diphosphate-sugar epimerase
MKAIVTGGCGFIGFNLCKKLIETEYSNIQVIDDLSTGFRQNKINGVDYHYISILNHDFKNIIHAFKPDVIFHIAAVPRVSYSVEFPVETLKANVLATVEVLDAVRTTKKKQARVIFSSSSSVYGGADHLPTPESCPRNPKSPYALEKAESEMWLSMYASLYGVDAVSLRYFNVFGPRSRWGGGYSTVLSAWLYSLYIDKKIVPYLEGDGKQSRDFCYVDNVVQANIFAARHSNKFAGEVYNIAQGERHSLLECKEIIEKISGQALNLEYKPARIGDVDHTLADISAARRDLGYNPSVDFESQVKEMADWYKGEYTREVSAGKTITSVLQ